MTTTVNEVPQARIARLAGAMFLLITATGIFGEIVVRGSLLSNDASQSAQNLSESEQLFRLGIIGDLATFTGALVLIWALYVLLRPVHRDLSLLGAFFRLIETAVVVVAAIGNLMALQLLSNAAYLNGLELGELQSLSRLSITAFGYGYDVAFIFLGLGSSVFAYLLLKSGYIPRLLAGWGIFASLLFATYHVLIIAFPATRSPLMYFCFAPMGIYELSIGFWLLLKGVKTPEHASKLNIEPGY